MRVPRQGQYADDLLSVLLQVTSKNHTKCVRNSANYIQSK